MNNILHCGKHFCAYSVPVHSHENWELVYCTYGSGEFIFENTTISYQEHDIVVIPPNIAHTNAGNNENGFQNIYINLNNATLPFIKAVKITDNAEKHILSAFSTAYYYYNNSYNGKEIILSSVGQLIVNYITSFNLQKPLIKIVEEIKDNIIMNFADTNYKIDEYLRTIPFNEDYLTKLFKNEIGVTPHKFLIDMRLQNALHLLYLKKQNEYNISTIAHMCGFDDPLYFSRIFKKYYGYSPKNYNLEKD